jgi:ABC-2 type transport system permease protein
VQGRNVFLKALRDQKWQVAGFGLTLASIAMLDVFIWPSYRDTLQQIDLPDALQSILGSDLSIATGPGFLSAEFFSWVPILMLVYAIIQGTAAIAGEESAGTMDLLLAQPLRRRDLVLARIAAAVAGTTGILALACIAWLLSMPFVSIDVTLARAVLATANIMPVTLLFFALSLWLGAVLPARAAAVACTIGLATAAYFVNALASAVQSLDGLKYASPFYYYGSGQTLIHGLDWPHIAALTLATVLCGVFALRAFESRDIGAGASLDIAGSLRTLAGRVRTRGRAPASGVPPA